jgi:hypothetical protein
LTFRKPHQVEMTVDALSVQPDGTTWSAAGDPRDDLSVGIGFTEAAHNGDFLRRRVDLPSGVWDGWLQECIAASRERSATAGSTPPERSGCAAGVVRARRQPMVPSTASPVSAHRRGGAAGANVSAVTRRMGSSARSATRDRYLATDSNLRA